MEWRSWFSAFRFLVVFMEVVPLLVLPLLALASAALSSARSRSDALVGDDASGEDFVGDVFLDLMKDWPDGVPRDEFWLASEVRCLADCNGGAFSSLALNRLFIRGVVPELELLSSSSRARFCGIFAVI